jgi:hypothetical protein
MRMWIQDESDYPSGFAGGYISERYPELGMQDIVADITVHVAPGQTLADAGAFGHAGDLGDGDGRAGCDREGDSDPDGRGPAVEVPDAGRGHDAERAAPQLAGAVLRHVYLSSPTRNFNRADGTRAKDATYTIIDYLDPKATDAFLHTVHETYYNAVGDQFGKIVLGFFGDEPDYSSGIPWTPKLLEEFKAQKGYDLAPYIPSWFDRKPISGVGPGRAGLLRRVERHLPQNSFFGEQANWAKAHNVEYLVHLNHEETMLALERSEGDYFRDERYVEVPGIDNLNQLIPSACIRAGRDVEHQQQLPQAGQSRTRISSASPRCGRKKAAAPASTASTSSTSNWCAASTRCRSACRCAGLGQCERERAATARRCRLRPR